MSRKRDTAEQIVRNISMQILVWFFGVLLSNDSYQILPVAIVVGAYVVLATVSIARCLTGKTKPAQMLISAWLLCTGTTIVFLLCYFASYTTSVPLGLVVASLISFALMSFNLCIAIILFVGKKIKT